jgi:hypothetical protein
MGCVSNSLTRGCVLVALAQCHVAPAPVQPMSPQGDGASTLSCEAVCASIPDAGPDCPAALRAASGQNIIPAPEGNCL